MKRMLDVIIAGIASIVLSPVWLACALAVRLTMGAPILFRQRRPGLRGRPFTLLKFRTMRTPKPREPELESDAVRLTRLGSLLRKLSFDELPQLWNVLRGDMSLVGPRPLLMQYLDRYTPEQARRHEVKPGLTGLCQVRGRNALSWDDKFALDIWYVDHHSLWLDVRIMFATLWRVFRRDGISQEGHATMPEFMGSKSAANQR